MPDTAPPPTAEVKPPVPARGWGCLGVVLALSLLVNLLVVLGLGAAVWYFFLADDSSKLQARHFLGKEKAANHLAVIHIEGVLIEGLLGQLRRQIDAAARDPDVKAVVVRVVSPGGTASASEDIYRRLVEL